MSATPRLPEDSPLARAQRAFAAHLRDPEACPPPADVEDRRMQVYRELVYANVESLLASNFPVLRGVLRDGDWHAMIRDFLAHHDARTPLFTQLATELLAHLDEDPAPLSEDVPFLRDLAEWEWIETDLLLGEDSETDADVDPHGDLLGGVPVLSPLVRWLRSDWPVHRIDADWRDRPPAQGVNCLVAQRGADDDVRFMEVTPVTLRLIELVSASPSERGRTHLSRLAEECGVTDANAFVEGGRHALEDLRRRGVIRGSR